MKTILELPEIDFRSSEYLKEPLKTLASYAQKFKVGKVDIILVSLGS